MEIVVICSLCVCAVMISKLLDKGSCDIKSMLTVSIVAMLAVKSVSQTSEIIAVIDELTDKTELSYEYVKIMFKALGICLVCRISTDCCKDAGENAIASQIELLCRASLIVISLPLYRAVIEIIVSLIGA